jgi:hypothetical protein
LKIHPRSLSKAIFLRFQEAANLWGLVSSMSPERRTSTEILGRAERGSGSER